MNTIAIDIVTIDPNISASPRKLSPDGNNSNFNIAILLTIKAIKKDIKSLLSILFSFQIKNCNNNKIKDAL